MAPRAVKGERYATNPEWAAVLRDELPYLDFDETLRFYRDVVPGASRDDLALIGVNDRFFLLTVLLGRHDANHPWLFDRCREVEASPDGHLDLWAREHYKSTIITFAGIIQEVLADPEMTVGIFSHTKSVAEKFLLQIMRELESNRDLLWLYGDVLWELPRVQTRWSVRDGIVLKRKSNPKEATIEAHGLVDGQPTGRHFGLMVYDDVVTRESVTNPGQVKKTTEAWELSDNLGAGNVRKWHIGTRYCSIGSMRVLMADWSHKRIEDVRVGDSIVGWELRDGKRWLRAAKVTNRGVHFDQPVNTYTFANGREVTCTADHRWWRGARGSGPEYAPLAIPKARDRRKHEIEVVGEPAERGFGRKGLTTIRELMVPAEKAQDRDSGWIAGMYDGEGTMKVNANHPSGVVCIVQSMHNPDVVDEIRAALRRRGFTWNEAWWSAEGRPAMRHDRCIFQVAGGWRERYRFLAEIAPTRSDKIAASLFGQLQTQPHKLVRVAEAGRQDVHWLETETGNYVIEGFCSSNSFSDTYGVILERKILAPRIYPATDNGRMDGTPVFMDRKRWEEKKRTQRSTLAAQMLQNPLAGAENTFKAEWLRPWEVRPSTLTVYIMADPSRGRSASSDRTAIAVVGMDAAGNKYLLDGFRHRMTLSERWQALKNLYLKWSAERGVQHVAVGYERYGQQSDDEYFQERMAREGFSFPMEELNWTRDGTQSKRERVERLEPDFRMGRFFLPAVVYEPGEGDCLWSVDVERGHVITKPMRAPTRNMEIMRRAGREHLVARSIRRKDEDGKLYDVTRALMEEMLFFPFAPKDDLVDVASRIYDMQAVPPAVYEDAAADAGEIFDHFDA